LGILTPYARNNSTKIAAYKIPPSNAMEANREVLKSQSVVRVITGKHAQMQE